MNRLHLAPALLVVCCFILGLVGCSGGSSPVAPPTDNAQNASNPATQVPTTVQPAGPVLPTDVTERTSEDALVPAQDRMVFGVYDIGIDRETHEITILPNRAIMIHFDVTQMITPPQCTDCIGIQVLNVDPVTNIFSLNVSIKNPTAVITGYDVRGTLLFPEGDDRRLVNADDYTMIFTNGVRSPFKAFAKTELQRMFGPGVTHYEQYDILFPPPANLYVTYVVDASYPGNQEEIYTIDNIHFEGDYNECNSGEGWLYVDLNDWQGNEIGVQLDLTPLGGGIVDMVHIVNQSYGYYLNNEWLAAAGDYELWLMAASEDTEELLYDIYTLTVDPCDNWPPQWEDTVGVVDLVSVTGGLEVQYGVATDDDAPVQYNIYFNENEPIQWPTTPAAVDTDESPFLLDGLSDDTVYYVAVRAQDALGAEEKNTVQMSGTPSNPPVWQGPAGIQACNPLDQAVEVEYGIAIDPQTPVTYNVYYSETSPIDFDTAPFVNDTESPTIVDSLNNFQEYFFAVRAIDAVGSEDDNILECSTIPNGAPEWVDTIGIQSTMPGHHNVTVTYGVATDIDLPIVYNVYYSETTPIDFDTAPHEVDVDGSPHSVEGLNNGQDYYFAVRAEDSIGTEEQNTVELLGIPNEAPTWESGEVGVQDLIPFDQQVTVYYGHALDPDQPVTYYIYYSTTTPINFGTASFETTTDESPYVLGGLDNYVPIYIAVRAEDSLGIRETNTNEMDTIPNPAPIWDSTVGVTSLQPGNEKITAFYGTAHDLDTPVGYTVYYSDTSPINFGTAPSIDAPAGSPTLIEGLTNGIPYFVACRAYDVFGHEEQNTVTLSAIPMGLPEETWSIFTGGVVQASPMFIDLNGDSVDDVVVGDQANKMVAYNGVDGTALWTFPTGGWVDSSAAISDMGGIDTTPDVIFGCLDSFVYCVDGATGLEIWSYETGAGIISSPSLANIKNDFRLDVIIGSMDGSVYALDGADGTFLWEFPTGAGVFSSPANTFLPGDAIEDFVVGSRDGNVYAINGATGIQIWVYPINDWVNSSPALADITGDSVPDAVIAGLDGDVHAINGATGLNIWTFPTGSYVWTSPSVGFLNGDGTPDFVLGADSSDVYAIDGATGGELWSFSSNDRIWSSAALVDLTEDNIPEAVVGSDDGYLYGIDGSDGSLLFNFPTGDWIDSSPCVGDIDGNTKVDIAFGRFDGYVTLVEVEYSVVGIMPWPMFRGNLNHSAEF